MADLSLRERLQPALLDRLLDDERLLTLYSIRSRRTELARLGVSRARFGWNSAAQGLRQVDRPGHARRGGTGSHSAAGLPPTGGTSLCADQVAAAEAARGPTGRRAAELLHDRGAQCVEQHDRVR